MAGYRADLAAIDAAARALEATADALSAALDGLDGEVGAIGPGRIGASVAGLADDARRDLTRVLGVLNGEVESVRSAARGYADLEAAAAAALRARAGE